MRRRAKRNPLSSSKAIIIDFDLTRDCTQPAETQRAARRWRSVMEQAPDLKVHDGTDELIWELDACAETLAIVTKSPDMVLRFFVKRLKGPIRIVLGYHQAKRRTPDPEALTLAMRKPDVESESTFHVGDSPGSCWCSRVEDLQCGVHSCGSSLSAENLDHHCGGPGEIAAAAGFGQ